MAALNGSQRFAKSKRKTKAYKTYPKDIREMFNIDNIYENGIFKIEPGNKVCSYDKCYVFRDINYETKDDREKTTILLLLIKWLNSMNTDFKITLGNLHRDKEAYLESIFSEKNKDLYPEIAEGLNDWKKEKMKEGNLEVSTLRLLTITCRAESPEDARIYFNGLEPALFKMFGSWNSAIRPVEEEERLRILHAFFHPGNEETYLYKEEDRESDAWRRKVFPADLETYYNFLKMEGRYVSVLFARDYDDSLDEGKVISAFTNTRYPSLVTLDYAPVTRNVLKEKLQAAHMNNEKAISDEVDMRRQAGQIMGGISYSKERKKDELEGYQEQITDNNESCFFVGLLLVITAETEELLGNRVEQMIRIGKENGVILNTYNHRQLKALNTALPIGGRQVDVMFPFLSSSVIALQPFHALDVQEADGYVYGVNETTKNLIVGNRKKLKNPHGMIVGHTGSGKSMHLKMTEIAPTLVATDDDITIIDPQNEFRDICEAYGGTFLDFTPKGDLFINPFEVPEEVFYGTLKVQDDFIAKQSEYAKSFCVAVMKNIEVTQVHYSFIDAAVSRMYRKYFKANKMPKKQVLITDFRAELEAQIETADDWEKSILKPIHASLLEYTEGSYDMFARPSNVKMDKRFNVFGLKNTSKQLWEPVMITIMHFLSVRMEFNQKLQRATHLVVDESQEVCKNDTSAEVLLNAIVTYRKFGGICTLALQNLTRALQHTELRDMFSNCEYKCFFDQGGVDAQALADVQELSHREYKALEEELPGHGVMVWGKKVLLLDAFMSHDNVLYKRFSTNFHEKAEEKAELQNG